MVITFTLLPLASSNLDQSIRLDEAVRVVGSESSCRVSIINRERAKRASDVDDTKLALERHLGILWINQSHF